MNETTEIPLEQPTPPKRSWRRFPRGRKAIAAGAAVAGLAIGGIGFGAGYAVADNASPADTTHQTTGFDQGDRGFPDGGMGGRPGGQMGGTQDGTTDGTTGQAPDFDGDGQPDETAPDTSTDTESGSTAQQG